MKEKEKICIIIINYNDEKHISNAIKCAASQTLHDIQIVCVDDGSTDRSKDIMHEWEKEDSRIQVIELKENSGTAYSRKVGIEACRSQYIMFLDSDDELEQQACQEIYNKIQEERCDILCFGVEIINDGNTLSSDEVESFNRAFNINSDRKINPSGRLLVEDCFIERLFCWNLWNKCYESALLTEAVKFIGNEKVYISEDMLLTYMALSKANKFVAIPESYYKYRAGNGMTTKKASVYSRKRMMRVIAQYPVIDTLKRWIEQLPDNALYWKSFNAIREIIETSIMFSFFHLSLTDYADEDIQAILQYISKQQLAESAISYAQKNNVDPNLIIERLAKSTAFTESGRKPIKTVGMYYYRLYNGGIERVMSLLTKIWMNIGYQVIIITEEPENALDYELPAGVKRAVLGSKDAAERTGRWWEIIEQYQIDEIVYHSWVDPNIIWDQIAIKTTGIPLVLHTHLAFYEAQRWTDLRWSVPDKTYALFDTVVALSEVDKEWWSALGFRTYQVVNPSTFNIEETETARLDNHECLWVGRLSEVKQYEEAFEIAREVKKHIPDFLLRVVGTAETEEEFIHIKETLEMNPENDCIVLEGYQKDMGHFYKNASVFLSTSRVEGFPMTFIESKSYGLPMVAYFVENLDLLRYPEGVAVVSQKDREKAANSIISILKNQDIREQMGREARLSIIKKYKKPLEDTWKEILERESGDKENNGNNALEIALKELLHAIEQRNQHSKDTGEIERKLAETNERLASVDHQLYCVVNTKSWKIGRMITYIPRHLGSLIKSRKKQ